MAKKDNDAQQKTVLSKTAQSLATNIQNAMDRLYTNTYFNTPTNNKSLEVLKKDIDLSINNIFSDNMDKVGIPNISSIYKRLSDMQSDTGMIKDMEEFFSDKSLIDSITMTYQQNSWIKDMRDEIDMVCKYMPKLEEALQVRKDNVLSADYFNKDYIFVSSKDSTAEKISFSKRINEIKNIYHITEKSEEWYEEAAKYGEQFIYIVPYEKALSKLLANKRNTTINSVLSTRENAILEEGVASIVCEGLEDIIQKDDTTPFNSLHIELCTSNILEDTIYRTKKARDRLRSINETSLNYVNEAKGKFDKHLIDDDLEFEKFDDGTDGLYTLNQSSNEKIKITTQGCVISELDATNVIPIYIDNLCMGYYYIECDYYTKANMMNTSDPALMSSGSSSLHYNNSAKAANNKAQDNMLQYISANLSKYIDAKFVNANQDLRKEIYMVLKHNDIMNNPENAKIKVTFIPPEDMVHINFKLDKQTHHGVSDLALALLPAKLYISLLLSNVMGLLTRGQDKRVYYVKQNVETNIAKTLINVMNQVKKGNMGIRQIENINNILNITGRYNDYLIPVGPNGDPAISFEVMQGQQIDVKTDLMSMLEEMAINTTDVPLDVITSRQSVDYAIQLTMSNSKFLRKVYTRQGQYQRFLSDIVTKIYNCEYNENISLEVKLPSPLFISMTNTTQLMNNNRDFVQAIVDNEMADETNDVVKALFTKNLTNELLSTYLDRDMIERVKSRSKQQSQLIKTEESGVLIEQTLIDYYHRQRML